MSVFYGWKISALALAGNFLLQGSALYGMNAFMEPLCESRGWSRLELNLSMGLAAFMGQLIMPAAAAVAIKISLRLLMTLGALIGGLATCALGYAENIQIFTFFLILVWISSQFCGGVIGNALISNWFSHYRGVAFGVANSGSSISGMILPMICLVLINHMGLKAAFMAVGLAACLLAPLTMQLVRRSPQSLGMRPDGLSGAPAKSGEPPQTAPLREIARSPAVWFIGVSFGLALMCGAGVLSQLKPRISDIGADSYTAMILASLAAAFSAGAKYFWGWICDRWSPILASRGITLCCLFSMFLSFLPQSAWTLGLFGVCFSSGYGGLAVVLPAVTASYFGSARFLSVYRVIAIFILLRCLGFPIMGFSHELVGSYLGADIVFTLCLALAAFLTFRLNPEKAWSKAAR